MSIVDEIKVIADVDIFETAKKKNYLLVALIILIMIKRTF